MTFCWSIITAQLWRPEVARRWKKFKTFFAFFEKDPLQENFQNSVSKGFITTPIHVLCSNFVKFGQREISEVTRYLRDNNTTATLCPGLPGWAGTRRNTHPPTILIIIQSLSAFYSAPQCSHCKCCTSYSNSVCLSVCPSHAGIVSKRRHVARCSFHCQIAKCV